MRTFLQRALFLLLATGMSLSLLAADAEKKKGSSKPGKLQHVVSFKFKKSATPEQIDQVVKDFKGLKKQISQIDGFKWGTNVSPEKHDKGFTHTFILTFASDKDRDDYLIHAAHKEFGAKLGPVLEDVFVMDFWPGK
ncbi:MAG: Dabb family protein [Verrucomicrobia bacterium]|nr:Dabb family protein [Verrucomicrobiota bacterium]